MTPDIAVAGTDRSRSVTARGLAARGPAIILVEPQLGENIGACARAMLNCGLTDMRLVNPRDGWPNPAAETMAAGAVQVLEAARVYQSTSAACAELAYVLATTARTRGVTKPALTPRRAVDGLRSRIADGLAAGVLFGPERAGLVNEDVTLADAVVTVPLNPGFSSLNLAQAVLLVGYEWYQAATGAPGYRMMSDSPPATVETREFFFERLESTLEQAGFFFPEHLGPTMKRNLRTLFTRAGLTEQEVQTLHGVLKSLTGRHRV